MRKAVQKSWSLNFGKCRDPDRCLVVKGLELAEPRASERVILEVGQGGEEKAGAQVLGCRVKVSALPRALPGVPSASTAWTVPPLQGLASPGTSPGSTGRAPRGSEARTSTRPPPTHPHTPTHPLCIPKDLPSGRAVFSGDIEGEAKRKTGGRRGQLHPPPPLGTPTPPTDPQMSAGPHLPLSFAATAPSRAQTPLCTHLPARPDTKGAARPDSNAASTSKLQPFPKEKGVWALTPSGRGHFPSARPALQGQLLLLSVAESKLALFSTRPVNES